jgi:hypothetical protein
VNGAPTASAAQRLQRAALATWVLAFGLLVLAFVWSPIWLWVWVATWVVGLGLQIAATRAARRARRTGSGA